MAGQKWAKQKQTRLGRFQPGIALWCALVQLWYGFSQEFTLAAEEQPTCVKKQATVNDNECRLFHHIGHIVWFTVSSSLSKIRLCRVFTIGFNWLIDSSHSFAFRNSLPFMCYLCCPIYHPKCPSLKIHSATCQFHSTVPWCQKCSNSQHIYWAIWVEKKNEGKKCAKTCLNKTTTTSREGVWTSRAATWPVSLIVTQHLTMRYEHKNVWPGNAWNPKHSVL